ncbi:hypothetical protein QC762_305330 [Podospora pseudocomata]|uniref:Uncharacterized protein n=4 Tax=Podospora TaxID=5144 RepID=A0ABY6S691_PODCO|nr:hypothetical protein QC762_305330 [Podospora pseudocomata]KAK4667007.1 hypothetical protein QC763_305330 [Podospora pseudopauciseta]KAK4678185.1 hypothetical protein QC764_305330 [Podospora pseudoanserina]VBB77161.1 Putative protein of unknown function [Podospora comata]
MLSLRRITTSPTITSLPRRALSTTPLRSLKESNSADPSPQNFDHHKQDSLSKQKSGKGHWKPELASNSEEAVKADRSSGSSSIKDLQEKTKKAAEENAKAGTN